MNHRIRNVLTGFAFLAILCTLAIYGLGVLVASPGTNRSANGMHLAGLWLITLVAIVVSYNAAKFIRGRQSRQQVPVEVKFED